jgi:hypothetical protein
VPPGGETSTHYFSYVGGTGPDLTKSEPAHVTLNFYFCILWELRVMQCIPVSPGHEPSTHYFSYPGGTRTELTKKCPGTHYAKLVFLHPMGSVGHVVLLVSLGHETLMHYFSCSGGTGTVPRKAPRDTLRQNCGFASIGCFGSRSAFRCIRSAKHQRTIFHARVGPVRIRQKVSWDMLHQTCVFASGGICRSHIAF